jgi:glycosyltransferase involved in cell wall biosynthesis
MATACWHFPVYSQTFVYQELSQLMGRGFDVRFVYSRLLSRKQLPHQFLPIWRARRRLLLHEHTSRWDFRYYRKRQPAKVETLIGLLSDVSRLSREQLTHHKHFLQAFSFARMVQAYRPAYLHSYFFYEGSLFALVAAFLLDVPRGVSCYADHLLSDYVLKVVPLHLRLCSVIVATSNRIQRELVGMIPDADADRILVKPNAIDCRSFPASTRPEPKGGGPFRLVCVSRIEPKKGLLYLVDAVRALRDCRINVECQLIGSYDPDQPSSVAYAEELEARIRELDLGASIHLAGRRSAAEVSHVLQQSHVFVAPFVEMPNGDKDGIPTALLEAMATALPVVATDAGSMTEVIRDGADGVIVRQRDPTALAQAITDLLRDPRRRAELGDRAVQRIRSDYDVAVCEDTFHERVIDLVEQ